MSDLTVEEMMFVGEYIRDKNATRAYRAAFNYNGVRASENGWAVLHRPHVLKEVRKTLAGIAVDASLTVEMVRNDIANVLNADPRELFNVQMGACRNCHGVDHLYQRTIGEMNRDRYQHEMNPKTAGMPFNPQGGIGYDAYADPHPECPECNGKGLQRIKLTDTRLLSPEAASLLQTIEQTKNGIKITTRSKDTAREAAARLLGMNKDSLDVAVKLEDMTDEQLVALLKAK